jgi:endo-1,4-beta-xylanase
MINLSRRNTLAMALASASWLSLDNALGATRHHHLGHRSKFGKAAGTAPDSLNGIAKTRGLKFGSSIGTGSSKGELGLLSKDILARPRRAPSFADPHLRALMVEQCSILVPENELKWYAVRPDPKTYDFRRADMLVHFAAQHHMAVRGHNLFWNTMRWTPRWVGEYDFGSRPATAAEKMLRDHIFKVCRRYGKRIFSYDVINETLDPNTGELENTPFTKYLGWNVIDICYHAARQAAPHAELVYNDYPSWGPNGTHRSGILKLLAYAKKNNLPIDALGVQAHIGFGNTGGGPGSERDETAWRRFLDDVTGMGFGLLVTEFDINDKNAPTDSATRDRTVAELGKTYFDIILGYPQLRYVMAWGLVDKYSWLQEFTPRADGTPQRPAPYDDDYRPKPLREAMAGAFRAAPIRPAMTNG